MMKKVLVGLMALVSLASLGAAQAASQRVAVMVHRPSNRLAWGAVGEKEAFMLGMDRIFDSALDQAPGLSKVGPYEVNGIVQAMRGGLYYPPGDTIREKWAPFVEADIYVECDLSKDSLQWRAGTVEGEEHESERIAAPYRHPMASAAALVQVVFEAAEMEPPLGVGGVPGLEAEEPSPPSLFVEWGKWIGYRPHWLHHAPWQGPQASAKRILKEDPDFNRGAAWALPMLMRVPKERDKSPASIFYLSQAYHLVDSPRYKASFKYLRKYFKEPDVLRQAMQLFGVAEIDLGGALDMEDFEEKEQGMDASGAGGDIDELREKFQGPRFRRNLVLVMGPMQKKSVREAVTILLEKDESPEVRAAAAEMISKHHKGEVEAVRQAFQSDDAGEVRRAALAGLVRLEQCTDEEIAAAAEDADADVRLTLAKSLKDCPVEPERRRGIWTAMLKDESAKVRAAAMRQLHRQEEANAEEEAAVDSALKTALAQGNAEERRVALKWIASARIEGLAEQVRPLLDAEAGYVRAAAAWALARLDTDAVAEILDALEDDSDVAVQRTLGRILAEVKPDFARSAVFRLLKKARPEAREDLCSSAYQVLGSDRAALASAMRHDPSLMVNLAVFRLLDRLNDDEPAQEVLPWCAEQHPNEYIRARALRALEEREDSRVRELCLAAIESPFWIVRLEGADILSRTAEAEDAKAIRAAAEGIDNEWLAMALEDALCRAEGKPKPERVPLNLGESEHTEGGHTPGGFQTWIDSPPKDPDQARKKVDEGYRFGVKNFPPNVPGGSTLNNMNNNVGMRNIHLLESILEPLETKWKEQLPYLYYIALFDEPFGMGGFFHPERVKAMLLEAGRADLLRETDGLTGGELEKALPENLRRAYERYNAKYGGIASNWAVHMFRLTAQRKYPGLQIFPQSLSYMRKQTQDAFDMIEADGDYSWMYHQGNFFRDGTIGAVNRVINPGKPLLMITWMGWHRPNIINGNKLFMDTNYPDGPWRFRDYMGTRSGLALWATGTEAGFFDHIGFGIASNKDERGMSARAFKLKPWSDQAKKAVKFMMKDNVHWKNVEGKLAVKDLDEKGGAGAADVSMDDADEGELDSMSLEGGPDPLEKALQEKKDQMFEKLMTGISYMNIFNTDTTRALSNLPKPDTRKRDSLIICGRDSSWYADGAHFRIPATAVLQGFDMVPNYDCIDQAELMHYDTILLRSSRDGVTSELIKGINHWLRTKENGLLIVAGKVHSDNVLFPELTLDNPDEAFLWEDSVSFRTQQRVREAYKDRNGSEHTRTASPRLGAFHAAGGEGGDEKSDARIDCVIDGEVTPLLTTGDGEAVFARWDTPENVKSVVLFDGAQAAGPAYTEAIEEQILAVDEERGTDVKRNPWWGHTIYETDEFVVDVATSQLGALHNARPRKHEGVDVITGVVNPQVRHRECAMILKDYVGPYAGGKENWAVLAREKLVSMQVESPDRLRVEAKGVTRVTRIGDEPIRLADAAGFEEVDDQVQVWKRMREGEKAYSLNRVDGGRELHVFSPAPFTVVAE